MDESLHGNRKPGPLNLDIYSALLGGRPRIASREASVVPSERRRVRVDVPIEGGGREPLVDAALRDQLDWCLAQATKVLADVRGRVVGVFQESTIGRRDRRARTRVEVTIPPRSRARDAA